MEDQEIVNKLQEIHNAIDLAYLSDKSTHEFLAEQMIKLIDVLLQTAKPAVNSSNENNSINYIKGRLDTVIKAIIDYDTDMDLIWVLGELKAIRSCLADAKIIGGKISEY